MDVREVREALERLNGFTYHAADNQDAEDIKTVCAALTSIDPEAIRAEARAEALREAVSRARAWKWPEDGTGRYDLFNCGVEAACFNILADEPKEREAERKLKEAEV